MNLEDANTAEITDGKSANEVVIFMPEVDKWYLGGTMRCGGRETFISNIDSLASKMYYGSQKIREWHWHWYEVNTKYWEKIEKEGMIFSGVDEAQERMEILEIKDHPFFVGVQYHPEYTSRPFAPNPVFYAFILAASG